MERSTQTTDTTNNSNVVKTKASNFNCDSLDDSRLLKVAAEFTPTKIELSESLEDSASALITGVQPACFEKMKSTKLVIATLLGKLYLSHLKCCNQGYDLRSMKKGAATIIINRFERMAGYEGKKMEMLNSGRIVDFIQEDLSLRTNTDLQNILKAITKESNRINSTKL